MSTCWKCGSATPEGVVECEDGCQPQALRELMALLPPPVPDHIKVQINLYMEAVAANQPKFNATVSRFLKMLEIITMQSGLHEFAKPKPLEE